MRTLLAIGSNALVPTCMHVRSCDRYQEAPRFVSECQQLLQTYLVMLFPHWGIMQLVHDRLENCGTLCIFVASLGCVGGVVTGSLPPSIAGIFLTYAFAVHIGAWPSVPFGCDVTYHDCICVWCVCGVFRSYSLSMPEHIIASFRTVTEVEKRLVGVERLDQLARVRPSVGPVRNAPGAELPSTALSLNLDQVKLRYGESRLALQGVSFFVPAGSKVAVVGRSGAGKVCTFSPHEHSAATPITIIAQGEQR